eukprot:SAG31_NODE_27897_length_418_cov_1.438871_1_plen_115_part_10
MRHYLHSSFCCARYYKLYVNGEKVSDHELGAFTTYTERVYYDTWDVTAQLNGIVGADAKTHAVGVSLGDGWYAQATVNVGKPQLLLMLSVQYSDGSSEAIVSDTTWTVGASPVTK